jgi:hypothetical protein
VGGFRPGLAGLCAGKSLTGALESVGQQAAGDLPGDGVPRGTGDRGNRLLDTWQGRSGSALAFGGEHEDGADYESTREQAQHHRLVPLLAASCPRDHELFDNSASSVKSLFWLIQA